jgi:HB1/ASXL restriction endonuclease-like protein with HTH domain
MHEKRIQGESAKNVAIDVLRASRKPLHTKDIAKRVIDSGRCSGVKGQTPEATVAAMLAVGSKPGGPFRRVDIGDDDRPCREAGRATGRPRSISLHLPRRLIVRGRAYRRH